MCCFFFTGLPTLIVNTLQRILNDPVVGKWAESLKAFTATVKDTFMDSTEEHDSLCKFLHVKVHQLLINHNPIFSSSLVYTFHVGVNFLLNQTDFRIEFKQHFVGLVEIDPPCSEVLNTT